MKAKLFNSSYNVPAYAAMLMLPGLAIAMSSPASGSSVLGFAYGLTMALIGLKLAQLKRVSPKNLIHFFGITLLIPGISLAATSGGEFQAFYDFIYDAATGYLGRGPGDYRRGIWACLWHRQRLPLTCGVRHCARDFRDAWANHRQRVV